MSRKQRRRLAFERLEGREVPAVLAGPWADPTHLTLSFAPDGTAIAGHVSDLFASLDAQEPTATWEQAILEAFQTWAAQANVNISLVPDSGAAFGSPGPSQHDPRFGDIRIGAQPMSPDVMAITVPGDPNVAGSWTGDVLFNSQYTYGSGNYDLQSVALHEAGHALGLDDSTDPKSVMFGRYQNTTSLSSGDIAAIQALYGVRAPDSHEGSGGDDSPSKAATIPAPGSFDGSSPLVAFGDVSSTKDLDYYTFRGPSGYTGPATIRLQSAGISLLTTRLTVLDSSGRVVLGQARAESGQGDVVSVQLPQISPNATYMVLVQGATSDAFGIGQYGLAVTFDGRNTISPAALDTVLRGDYQTLGPNDVDALLRDPTGALVNNHHDTADEATAAIRLTSTPGYAVNTHYEAIGSLSAATDADFYRVAIPSVSGGQASVLTVTVRALGPAGDAPRVAAFDSNLNPLAGTTRVLANGDGLYTIQVTGLKPGGNVYLDVNASSAPGSVPGNYALEARFGTTAASLTDFASGALSDAPSHTYNLYIGQTQLFQFLLSATPLAGAGSDVTATIRDASGQVVSSFTVAPGGVVSAPALLLTPGAYTLQIASSGGDPSSYDLSGEALSDPLGPTVSDPTLTPVYTSPTTPGTFTYPGGVTTTMPFWLALVS